MEEELKKREEEKFKPPDELTESKIEKSEVKNRFRKRTKIQRKDLVVDEVSNARLCLDIDIQHEQLQQNHIPKSYFRKKVDGSEEINKVLEVIYVLFTTNKLKKI